MKIDFIPVVCKDNNLTILEVLFLYTIYNKDKVFNSQVDQLLEEKDLERLVKLEYLISTFPLLANHYNIKLLFEKYDEALINVPVKDINTHKVENWIQEYRDLFRTKCTQSVPMGNKNDCIVRMKWFIDKYPLYANKDLILKATIFGIDSITGKHGKAFVPKADNFIVTDDYKTNAGFPVTGKLYKPSKEYLVNYCEMYSDTGEQTNSTNMVGNIMF